jgi:hypothetical protein
MKIKGDFVTNSSSTSFTFLFKGKSILDLFSLMRKYKKHFMLEIPEFYDGDKVEKANINVEDVIDSIEDAITNTNKHYFWNEDEYLKIQDISDVENRIISYLDDSLKEVADDRIKGEKTPQYVYDTIRQFTKQLDLLEKAKENDFKALEIGFGDNHGEVCGGYVGYTMDYAGRSIRIEEEDLIVYTEQDR